MVKESSQSDVFEALFHLRRVSVVPVQEMGKELPAMANADPGEIGSYFSAAQGLAWLLFVQSLCFATQGIAPPVRLCPTCRGLLGPPLLFLRTKGNPFILFVSFDPSGSDHDFQ